MAKGEGAQAFSFADSTTGMGATLLRVLQGRESRGHAGCFFFRVKLSPEISGPYAPITFPQLP